MGWVGDGEGVQQLGLRPLRGVRQASHSRGGRQPCLQSTPCLAPLWRLRLLRRRQRQQTRLSEEGADQHSACKALSRLLMP